MKKCPLGDESLWKLFFGWISEQNYSSAKTMAPHCKPTSCYPRHSKSSVPNDHINQVADISWLQIRYEYLNLSFLDTIAPEAPTPVVLHIRSAWAVAIFTHTHAPARVYHMPNAHTGVYDTHT